MSAASAGFAPAAAAAPSPRRRTPAAVAAVLGLGLLLSLGVQAMVLTVPLLTMHVFDGVLESRNLDTLAVLAIAFATALLLGGVLRHLRAALLAVLAEQVGRRLQLRALVASVRVGLGGDRTPAALALRDVAELRRLLGGSVPSDLLDLVAIPLALAFLWLLHPLFFLVAALGCAVKGALGALADRATRRLVRDAAEAEARTVGALMGRLRQPDLLFGLGLLPAVLRRWAPLHLAALERHDAAQRRARALESLMQLAVLAQQIAIVGAGAWLLVRGHATSGVLMAALTMAGFATNPVARLAGQWRDWARGAVALRELRALAARGAPPAPVPPDPSAPPGLLIEALTLQPPCTARPLVSGLTLHLPPGSIWAVAGPNGAGKTTLLRAVLGLGPPQAGRVLLDGQDTWRADRAALGPRLGYLPQEAQLLEASVIENIGRFAGAPPAAAVEAARRAGAHAAIGRLPQGYDSPAGPDAGLSGGQRRLVALARALHGDPRLVVLDEPEAGLDAAGRAALRAGVAVVRGMGAVVLVVTHDPAAWQGTADGVLTIGGTAPGWCADHATDKEDGA
jgi:ATP-binding cassette subfamily C protein